MFGRILKVCRHARVGCLLMERLDIISRASSSSSIVAHRFKDTIYALSSGHGKCGVAVIRVSGSMSSTILERMGRYRRPPKPRQALLRTLVDPRTTDQLDSALVLWFPGPHSFTGEDCVELQVHGGMAVISAFLKSLSAFPNTRHAEPGEFTKRAFINGKLNLTQVEGLADVIHAETELQRRQALRQMSGHLSSVYNEWRQLLIKMTAYVAAYIDFSEEENIEDDVMENVKSSLTVLLQKLRTHLTDGRRGEILRSGVHVAIVGRPNVGKSSLLNYLTRKQTAIVSPIEGTTRDLIESSLDINGYPVVLVDTAGIRLSSDEIEQEGVRRAVNRSQEADLIIVVLDINELAKDCGSLQERIELRVSHLFNQHLKIDTNSDRRLLVIINKTDLLDGLISRSDPLYKDFTTSLGSQHSGNYPHSATETASTADTKQNYKVVLTSLTESQGVDDLMTSLTAELKHLCGNPLEGSASYTQARHRDHLQSSLEQLEDALRYVDSDVVVAAESLRLAGVELGRLTGVISSEEILDVVFRDFCIGK